MKFDEILQKVSSADADTLILCNDQIDSLIADEGARAQHADDKAKTVLTMCGVGAAVLVALAGAFNLHGDVFLAIAAFGLFSASVWVLAKAAYFSLKALVPSLGHRLDENLIFDLQQYDHTEAVRYSVVAKVWVYQRTVPVNNRKLFCVHSAMRNIVYLIVLILLAGFLAIAVKLFGEPIAFVATLILLTVLLFWDPAAGEFGVSWRR